MENMDALISIIVPVYNAASYLSQCIEMILAQTYSNWELLLINDGSTDESHFICQEYALQYPQIKYFEKSNGGVSSARNLGLQQAQGEFITFVDADDLIVNEYCTMLLKNMKDGIGMVVFGQERLFLDGHTEIIKNRLASKVYSYCEIASRIIDDGTLSGFTFHSVCSVLYRKSIINKYGLSFDVSIRYNEDGLFNTEYALLSKQDIAVNYQHVLYTYRLNLESASRQVDLTGEKYTSDMKSIECRLIQLTTFAAEANMSLQLSRRKATLALEKLIYLAKSRKLSIKNTCEVLKQNDLYRFFLHLNFAEMGIGKRCVAWAVGHKLWGGVTALLILHYQ